MNGANQYISIDTHTHVHTHTTALIHTHTYTHTFTQIQFLIREVASEVNWNGSTVRNGKFSVSS